MAQRGAQFAVYTGDGEGRQVILRTATVIA